MNTNQSSTHSKKCVFLPFFASLLAVIGLSFFAGCYSTDSDDSGQFLAGTMSRPRTVWVRSFAATPEELHEQSVMATQFAPHETPQTIEHINEGRELSREIADHLITDIQNMGLSPSLLAAASYPEVGDIILVGALASFDEGNAAKRIVVGFGAGKSSISAVSETFVVTPTGLLELKAETIDAGSKKSPGVALGLAGFVATSNPAGLIIGSATKIYGEVSGSSKVEGRAKTIAKDIADGLRTQFKNQGWVN